MAEMEDEKHPFLVGVEVYKQSSGFHNYLSGPYKVKSVYKTGRFKIEGDESQWCPTLSFDNKSWIAFAAGKHSYSRETVLLASDPRTKEELREFRIKKLLEGLSVAAKELSRNFSTSIAEESVELFEAALACATAELPSKQIET